MWGQADAAGAAVSSTAATINEPAAPRRNSFRMVFPLSLWLSPAVDWRCARGVRLRVVHVRRHSAVRADWSSRLNRTEWVPCGTPCPPHDLSGANPECGAHATRLGTVPPPGR